MPPLFERFQRMELPALLLLTFAIRAIRADQPIVENYVGRQVPTAMVARNLERGSGLLRPQLDTAPSPNYFLVEPPVYAQVVVILRGLTGLALEPSGRLVSALSLTLAAWGLFGLTRRREGRSVALLSVLCFACFPLTIRYGRAFQPDAMMLGALVAGLRCWDQHEAGGARSSLAAGWLLLATAFALKITAAYILVPLLVVVLRTRTAWKLAAVSALVVPAVAWYAHAYVILAEGVGSRASAESGELWLGVLVPSALMRVETVRWVFRFLVVRAFTPLGFALAVWGLRRDGGDRLWWAWGGSALAMMALLAGKLHHEYYWLALSPLAAVGVAKGLAEIGSIYEARSEAPVRIGDGSQSLSGKSSAPKGRQELARGVSRWYVITPQKKGCQPRRGDRGSSSTQHPVSSGVARPPECSVAPPRLKRCFRGRRSRGSRPWLTSAAPSRLRAAFRTPSHITARKWRRRLAAATAACLVGLALVQSASTWRTPPEWSGLADAARAVRATVPPGDWVVAPEALLFESDRRGCRLEWCGRSASRAAGEWGGNLATGDPLALLEFYRARGARYVADVAAGQAAADPARLTLHAAVRRRYNVIVDRPGVLLAALADPEDAPHGRR
jgi:hypothetical protein